MTEGRGRPVKYSTEQSLQDELARALLDWNKFNARTHRTIIRTAELMVMNRRIAFDLMTGEQAMRQFALLQGTLYGLKLVGSIAQAALDQSLTEAEVATLFVPDEKEPRRNRIDHDYEEFIDE